MRNQIYGIIMAVFMAAPGALAQTSSNAEFNPFPQMEQDLNSTNDQAAAQPQNEEAWSPINSDAQGNVEVNL
jgi:hypothetical protein